MRDGVARKKRGKWGCLRVMEMIVREKDAPTEMPAGGNARERGRNEEGCKADVESPGGGV